MRLGRVRVLVLAALVVASLPFAVGLSTNESQQLGNNLDLDIAYRDANDNVEYVDSNGNSVDTGVDSFGVGGIGDFDGDGDLDIAYRDLNSNVEYVDSNGNNVDTGVDASSVGGMGDFDGDGDLDIAYRDANNLEYVDSQGKNVDTGVDASSVGGMGDFDGDGDLDIAYRDANDNLEYVDSNGNNVDTGVDAIAVGGMGDFDGDTNAAPSVNVLTNPSQYALNDDVDVSVDASDTDGTVQEVCAKAIRSNTTATETLNQSCRTTSASSVTENFNGFFSVSDRGYNYTVNGNATDNQGATTTD